MRGGGDEIYYGMLYKEGHINKNWNHREIKLKSNDNSKYEILWYEKGGTKPKGSIDVTNLVTLNKSNKGENIRLEIKNNNINPRNYTTLKLESRSQDENNKLLELYYNLQLRKKQQELDNKKKDGSLQQDDIDAFSRLIDEAEAANIDEDKITAYKTKLKNYESNFLNPTYTSIDTPKLRVKQKKLDIKVINGRLQQPDIDAFSRLIYEAEAAKIDKLVIEPYKTKLEEYKSALSKQIYTPKLKQKQEELDEKVRKGTLQQDDISKFSSLIANAKEANFDESVINDYKKKLNEYKEELDKKSRDETRSKLNREIKEIEKEFKITKTRDEKPLEEIEIEDIAFRAVKYVYNRYPLISPHLTFDNLDTLSTLIGDKEKLLSQNLLSPEDLNTLMTQEKRRKILKKMLVEAQFDYHPDHNQGLKRDDLGLTPIEWEIISNTISQQLAQIYDKLSKGKRNLERDGGSRKRRRTRRRRKSRKYK